MFFISTNPKGKVYQDLIDLAFECCDEFVLVVRQQNMYVSQNAKSVLEKLSCSLKEVKEQYEWPGTILGGGKPALVYYFRTDEQAKRILKEVSNSLHSWVHPDLPEDLSFRKGEDLWLVNTSHEASSSLITNDKDDIDKFLNIRDLEFREYHKK